MYLQEAFIFLCAIYLCRAGYGYGGYEPTVQSDVEAPSYVPSYARKYPAAYSSHLYTKTGYTGTKTGYTGTKTGYHGTKTGYHGTKNGYTGTKTGYVPWSNPGYGPSSTGFSPVGGYAERQSWFSSGTAPSYDQFNNHARAVLAPKCDIECKNNGICVDTNVCNCPANFYGKYCEFEKKPCLAYPPLPMNSLRKCSSEFCTITCMAGHKFIDGTTVANMRCVGGEWQPTRADFSSIPDCIPECDPPCLNGGVCLSLNTCQCSAAYRGPQCQYSATACDIRKLAFNGGYNCSGDGERFSCSLSCPPQAGFSSPPAAMYTCLYSTGVFLPQPIPHCTFNEVIIITPSNRPSDPHRGDIPDNNTASESESFVHESTTFLSGKYIPSGNQIIVVQDLTPKGGSCLTWAGMHYKTFDGKIYSFQSPCQHILVRDAEEDKYTVAVRHPDCKNFAYCPSELVVYINDKMYSLSVGDEGAVLFRSTKRLIPMPASLPGIRVSMPSDQVFVNLDALGVTIKWDTNNLIVIEGSVLLWNKTKGLCGTLDGNPENDFLIKDGTIARTKSMMVTSWQLNKIGDICESNPSESTACASKTDADMRKATQFCNKVFSKDKFRKCSKVMDVSLLLEACEWDYCACTMSLSPEECACKTVSVYAKECLRHGIEEMVAWRDSETCPMQCPEGKVYKACGPDVQPSCAFPLATSTSVNNSCVEGCFCPEGLLLEGGRCIPKSECPCRIRNQSFKPGTVIPKSCNTCTCQAGEWTCTQVPCGARCSAVGDPHYTTFDGLRYDFMGTCTYTLLQTDNVTVEVENVACSGSITEAMNLAPYKGEGKPSCTKAVNIVYKGANIHMKQGGFILVNGKEVSALPVNVGDIRIRAASSLFVIVQLPIKVDLWWDGNTRVFVDVPPEFHQQTKGLCGTFNLNQKDDFLTPEGDVEQSAFAFANKWKTREFCNDIATKEPENPCHANVENKEAAEKYCSILKSALFESCHWYVDVQPYYENCLYDMCACSGDVSRCLCPMLGDYAMACAANGRHVQWRYNVKECELSCTGGQEYTVCADSCVRTCTDVALTAKSTCKPTCVEGCACPTGQVLDSSNVCVPIALCPCFHKGMEFMPGYKEVRAGTRERELCTCVGARWDCVPATPEEILRYPPAEDLRSNCSSLQHREFTTCELAEPLTCKNMHLPPLTRASECRPGCQCKKGFVLDTGSGKCVQPTNCPCHHGGRSYADGEKMQEECNTCECKSGSWSCSARACSGVCSAWGDSHLATFDGTHYDFEGVCTYLLAKGSMDGQDGFSVEIQNVPCGTTGATCSKSVTLRVTNADGSEESISLSQGAPLPDATNLKRIKLRIAGAYVFADVPSLGMSLQWDRELRVYVKVDAMWQNRVKGLCGNYNSDMRDDFQTPSGGGFAETSALIFADSWKLKPTCPKPQEVADHCKQRPQRKEWATTTCGALKRFPFSLCHAEVPVEAHVRACEADACACDAGDDCRCACAAIANYAYACAARGVTFDWRKQDLCPMQCDTKCSNYNSCMSPCPPETCDNMLDYDKLKAVCEKESCIEGCQANKTCPEGTVYSNSSLTECVPRAKCRPVCMTLEDGREILEGDVIEADDCHTCRCSKKTKVCSGQPCPTTDTTPSGPPTSPKPHDQPLGCVTGWTPWLNRGPAEIAPDGASIENEPLPRPNELVVGAPMCKPDMMKTIECRTVVGHKTAKETGLNVECSLEQGLVCRVPEDVCPDFEIRVYCKCEEPFRCMNSTHPNHPHPTDCSKFYECTPEVGTTKEPHAVLKQCGEGLLYNPVTMVCDWPQAVYAVRPECEKPITTTTAATPAEETAPTGVTATESPGVPRIFTSESFVTTASSTIATPPLPTSPLCPPGQVFSSCAYPCDNLCEHFLQTLRERGECLPGQKCVKACIDESIANIKCEFGSKWRDDKTCVPIKDCTCYDEGHRIKPGGVVVHGCEKCQCLDNALHCDTTDCVSIFTSVGPTHMTYILEPKTTPATFPTIAPTKPTTVTISSTWTPTTVEVTPTPTLPPKTTLSTTEGTTHAPTEPSVETTVPTTETPLIIKSTNTPPPKCDPTKYKNLLWNAEPLPKSAFTASSSSSPLYEPQHAELNGVPLDISGASWTPKTMDTNQYIQVEFPHREPVYGVTMQGSPVFDHYVTSYEVMYGDDGSVFSTVDGPDGKPKVFRGPVDSSEPLQQMIEPPIEAKFIRIRPLTWHKGIAVRLELIGCEEPITTTPVPTTTVTTPEPMQCTDAMGLDAELPLDNIEVSSNNEARPFLKLDGERGWRPTYSTPGQWIKFDFMAPRNITGIKTKGGVTGWVTAYNVLFSCNLSLPFSPMVDMLGDVRQFPANYDSDTVVTTEFRPPIRAQYLKILPVKWNRNMEMRVEPIGCFEPYPTTTTVAPTPTPSSSGCEVCPGVRPTACNCTELQYFDGETCVSRDQCPCVEGFMTYAVGSIFRGTECDECMCKLGGITDCKPIKECKCEPDMVPKLSTSTCECSCEACPDGTRICPTSALCLPLEKWCDGLQDCGDDERDCITSTAIKTTVTEPTFISTAVPIAGATPPATTTTTQKPERRKEIKEIATFYENFHPRLEKVPKTLFIEPKNEDRNIAVKCPKVECPRGYFVQTITGRPNYISSLTSDLPPPRPRNSYQRYQTGAKTWYGRKGGFSKTAFSKGGFSKGGYTPFGRPKFPQQNQAFSLDKPALTKDTSSKEVCPQFKCIPKLPPPPRPGSTLPPLICSAPLCPQHYSLKLESVPTDVHKCPQYVCVPPVERPVYCNVTGRTFNTFDGVEYKYDICFHILARDNRFDAWTVIVRKKCRPDGCVNQLMVLQDDQLILVKPNLMIEYNNFEYTVEQTRKICFQKNSFDVDRLGNGVSIKSRKYNFTVLYSTNGDIKIGLLKTHLGGVDGLCGAYDGDSSNDRRLPSGQQAVSIDQFGRSWAKPGLKPDACQPKVIPPKEQKKCWDMCDVLTKEPISQCAKVLNLDKWRTICLEKVCECAEQVVNGTKRSEEECRCKFVEQLVAECLAADKDLDIQSWRMNMNCPAECAAPLVHYDCYRRRSEPTCAGVGAGSRSSQQEDGLCFPGCYCPEGRLRKGDQCIAPTDCLDCTCHGLGTPSKYQTFEGDDLPFLGNCTYLASRDRNETGNHKYQVYVTNEPCADNKDVACTKSIYLIYEKNIVQIAKESYSNMIQTTINDEPVFKYPLKNEWAEISKVNGEDVTIKLPDIHVELSVLRAKLEFSVRVPSYQYANQTEGLCGVCMGYQDKLITRNGTVTDDFELYGKSWQADIDTLSVLNEAVLMVCGDFLPEPVCDPLPPERNPCLVLNNVETFGECHALVDPAEYIAQCEDDLCAWNTTDACPSLEMYAAECRRQGVCLQWRNQELCPYPCESPMVYRECVDCERTCENYDILEKNPEKCDTFPVDGCFCPKGKVRVNNTCIEPKKCFPCDAKKEHYSGDEWQEDACTKCTCSKLVDSNEAQVSCVKQTCTVSVCGEHENLVTKPAKPGQCCPEYMCVPKPIEKHCEEPKKMECGFGQVLKQKNTPSGCKEFSCECKPASECEAIPPDSEVEIMEPGMERVIDSSGCCPRAQLVCRRDSCPKPPVCPEFHNLNTTEQPGQCCPEHKCVLPKDKCIAKLEWEAAARGGEKPREVPQSVLKDVDAVWLDGPCRSCRCNAESVGAVPQCGITECPPLATSEEFVMEALPVPFECCPRAVQAACRYQHHVYKVGENWTSPDNPCETYHCVKVGEGQLDRVTKQQYCDEDCQPGWEYVPADENSGQCCGKCKPVACVCEDTLHPIGQTWASPDFCTNYTCVDLNGTLQVQSANETCPKISEEMQKQFVLTEEKVPGKCCPKVEPVACRVDDKIYQVGENWTSETNACESYECARTGDRLERLTTVHYCHDDCQPGWEYIPSANKSEQCCGTCEPVACVCEGVLHPIGEVWTSADFCTNYTCVNLNGTLQIQSFNETCPEISESMEKQFVLTKEKMEGKCCPKVKPVACRVNDKIYEVGQNWTSPTDACESYECARAEDGKLEKVTTVQSCDYSCQPGWEYVPSVNKSEQCCGRCKPVACVCEGVLRLIGEVWTSKDFCTNYTCVDLNGTLQVQSFNETCPEISESMEKQFVLTKLKVEGKCCPKVEPVACRVADKIYQVGENWTSPTDACESYQCARAEDGKLEKVTTVQSCDDDCQPGWEYVPSVNKSEQCCGRCKPVACMCEGVLRLIGEVWTSKDFCTNYTCVDLNGTLQVQSANEKCPVIKEAMLKQFVYSEEKVVGKCCPIREPVACRVGDTIYQEGQSWTTTDPCVNATCARDSDGQLSRKEATEGCVRDCPRGWLYKEPPPGVCCSRCVQFACLVDDKLRKPGETWQSGDNCTTFSCERDGEEFYTTSLRRPCPDVSACAPEDLVNETCCQVCKMTPSPLSTCVPKSIPSLETLGLIRVHMGPHGFCVNREPVPGFRECRGSCDSGTLYNNQTGAHDSKCECCAAVKYERLVVGLVCEDGSRRAHSVASPERCVCQRCGGAAKWTATKTGVKGPRYTSIPPRYNPILDEDYNIPDMFARFGTTGRPPPRL
ncbi:PREDICTED: hemocytin isoform X2 [Papilio xuthus]|uniref:Hemocytin isoform X2 n=1 Tax=Papilio xuthus TaxID=66420 RepID=A0AAJ6ZWG1_PAPXU|nr:PREDICTED: hemocytin isoform X2 [Papilio xuthus]